MSYKQFLILTGIAGVLLGVLGYVGIIGPTHDHSIFGHAWFFNDIENGVHLLYGVLALVFAFLLPKSAQPIPVIAVAILGLYFAAYNLFRTNLLGADLQRPLDILLHATAGIWAIVVLRREQLRSAKQKS
jgi:hypothetical protein